MVVKWSTHYGIVLILVLFWCRLITSIVEDFSKERKHYYRDKVKGMFYHAYNGYLNYADPYDELRPLTCQGMDTWGSFSLTLIDALDTLVVMGNHTEFARASELVLAKAKVDANVNVNVFETNIRVVGGLLSAHMLSYKVEGYELPAGWPCAGPLLDLAERFAARLLPAFNTATGMPYGTVNLRYGVHARETPITCTACIGSFILEFGTLSRLTGNPHYERIALRALNALWAARSHIGLVGNHINVETGVWTAVDSGIGAAVDSYFEYLVKGAYFFQRPILMHQFLEYEKMINKHVRKGDWFVWVTMDKAHVTLPIFQSLEAFYPGILALMGKVEDGARIMSNYIRVLRQYGVPPEFYSLVNRQAHDMHSGYPLRPEIVESLLYLYKATGHPEYLHASAAFVEAIERMTKTPCGYATVKTVTDFTLEDRMESFFLSETTKYLYLMFDDDNFIHNDGSAARVFETTDGSCVIDAGGYIFNTEAHPLDPGIVYCCGEKRKNDTEMLRRFEENADLLSLFGLDNTPSTDRPLEQEDLDLETAELDLIEREFSELSESEEELLKTERQNVKGNETEEEIEQILSQKSKAPNNASLYDEGNNVVTDNLPLVDASVRPMDMEEGKSASKDSMPEVSLLSNNSIESDASPMPLKTRSETFVQVLCDVGVFISNTMNRRNGKGSGALRRMANAIYGRQIREATNVRVVNGPICTPEEERRWKSKRSKLSKPLHSRFKNTPPDASMLESEYEEMDVVSEYSFSSCAYRKLAAQGHELLSSPPTTFALNFLGL